MRVLFVAIASLALTSCGPIVEAGEQDSEHLVDVTQTEDKANFKVICLDGVQYWINSFYGGNSSVLAPRINKDTLLPAKCPQSTKSSQESF